MNPSLRGQPNRTGIFLIHGLTGSPTEMAPLDKILRRAGYQTAVPLIAGHGAGHKELLATSWQDWLESLRRDLRQLARNCDAVVVVGLCVGGLLGLLLAAEEEKVEGLVSLAPDFNFRVPGPMMPWTRFLLPVALHVPWLRRHGYWAQHPPYGVKNPRLQQRIAKAVAASNQGQTKDYGTFRTYVGTIRELNRLRDEAMRALCRVTCPTLMVHSFEDSMFSIRNVTVMYSQLASPRKEVALVTGCDHVLTVDLRRNEVAGRILRFIAAEQGFTPEHQQAGHFFACDIFPNTDSAGGGDRKTHSLIVYKDSVVKLKLLLFEEVHVPRSRFGLPGALSLEEPIDGGGFELEWRLAEAATQALSFGLKKHLGVRTESEAARAVCLASPLPVF